MKQINFSRLWPKITPWLDDRDVRRALHFGLFCENQNYRGGPPWQEGRGPLNGQRARTGRLSWYQPWGRCHSIAPFSWAICQKLYPEYEWGFLTSERHTIAVGGGRGGVGLAGGGITVVADILLFKSHTAQKSIDFVKCDPSWSLCFSPGEIWSDAATEAWNQIVANVLG